jgi:hypothetical protein
MTRLSIAALGLLATLTCFAHTPLKASSPAADAAVTAPTALALEFGGEVRLTSLSLTDSAGGAKHLDAVPTAIASKFELAIHEPLAPGDYTVVWRAVGGDTHIVSGEFKFKVVAAPAR